VIDAASATAGTLFVQPRVGAAGDGELLDDVVAPRFLLATTSEQVQSCLSERSLDLWRRIGGERVVITPDGAGGAEGGIRRLRERDRLFADWMARYGVAAVVVRPDRYVYGIARDAGELNRMMEGLGRQIFG